MDLVGTHNAGEFYSQHYLDVLLDKDLKALRERWAAEQDGAGHAGHSVAATGG